MGNIVNAAPATDVRRVMSGKDGALYDEDGNLIRYESTGDDGNVFTEEYSDFVYFVKAKVEVIKDPEPK